NTMKTTTDARRPLTHILVPFLLAGTVGSLGVIRAEAASPSNLSAKPAASHAAHPDAASAGHGVRLAVSSGTSAEYRAREQLTFFAFPTDAVGTTTAVKGSIVLDAHGHIVPAQSTFVIDLRTLTSDRSQRDQFIQSNT